MVAITLRAKTKTTANQEWRVRIGWSGRYLIEKENGQENTKEPKGNHGGNCSPHTCHSSWIARASWFWDKACVRIVYIHVSSSKKLWIRKWMYGKKFWFLQTFLEHRISQNYGQHHMVCVARGANQYAQGSLKLYFVLIFQSYKPSA